MGTVDKFEVRRAFQYAAPLYDRAAVVQRRMVDELVDRLEVVKIEPCSVVDVGCGTGYAWAGLRRRFPETHLVMLDFASNMLAHIPSDQAGRTRSICADAEKLPLAAHSVDMIFCSAVLQCCDHTAVFEECIRVLKPGGLFTFATFGPDTLKELRAAWQQVDADAHVPEFTDMHNIGDALVQLQFIMPVLDVDYLTVTHRDVGSALRDLRALGASMAGATRSRGLSGTSRYRKLLTSCQDHCNEKGLLESTCEIIYGHAWAPDQLHIGEAGGGIAVPLSRLRRR